MSEVSQRDAVFQAVKAALKSEFKDGIKITLTDAQRGVVVEALVKDFQAKKVALKDTPSNQEKLKSPALLKTYVNGLLNNWLKRDPRLNGSPKKAAPVADKTTPPTPIASAAPAKVEPKSSKDQKR